MVVLWFAMLYLLEVAILLALWLALTERRKRRAIERECEELQQAALRIPTE